MDSPLNIKIGLRLLRRYQYIQGSTHYWQSQHCCSATSDFQQKSQYEIILLSKVDEFVIPDQDNIWNLNTTINVWNAPNNKNNNVIRNRDRTKSQPRCLCTCVYSVQWTVCVLFCSFVFLNYLNLNYCEFFQGKTRRSLGCYRNSSMPVCCTISCRIIAQLNHFSFHTTRADSKISALLEILLQPCQTFLEDVSRKSSTKDSLILVL